MHVVGLWRYPIKSVGGESLPEAVVTENGIRHDRGWGLVDDRTDLVLTARREPRLLFATAHMEDDTPMARTDAGDELRTSAEFSEWLDRPVTLAKAEGRAGGTYEVPLDFENDADWVSWQGPPDAWHDNRLSRVSLVSETTIDEWDFRRFRSNILLDGGGEDALVGHEVEIGSCRLEVMKRIDRCVIVTRPQPGLDRDLDVLRTINADREACLGIGARVVGPGTMAIGDTLVGS